mgnify:CR=1 FL=1
MTQDQRRSYFRIIYTNEACPKLRLSASTFSILDVSEQGFRFSLGNVTGIKVGDMISGTITFEDNESFIVNGTAMRVTDQEVSVRLKKEIPLRKIMSEQRRLLRKHSNVG